MILFLTLVLLFLMITIGGERGAVSIMALAGNIIILFFSVILMSAGFPALLLILAAGAGVCYNSLFYQNGNNVKTRAAFLATLFVMLILFIPIFAITWRTGSYGLNELQISEEDFMYYYNTDISINMLHVAVFVSVFSTLGAVIDTALSVTSSVYEVWTHKNSLVEKELTSTGYQVGKEIIGTTVNTLLFAYLGGSILLFSYVQTQKYSLEIILNSRFLFQDVAIMLFGATTENPYFEVNGALISRSRIFELKPLENADIRELLERALHDKEKGMGSYRAEATDEALDFLADMAGGDARAALNAIELGILTTERSEDGLIHITLDVAQECIQRRAVKYDKTGDNHYDTISAFIKSMRGTDPDAAVYYLAKMLDAGEDIKFIARRIMICASEDVGNADPQAIQVAVSAALAVERIGLPEARIILSQAATYVASAPKSNAAYVAVDEAQEAVRLKGNFTVPSHLRDCHYSGAEKLGHGDGYKYAHDYPNHYVKQQYLPDGLEGSTFYRPSENGYEKKIGEWLRFLKGSE